MKLNKKELINFGALSWDVGLHSGKAPWDGSNMFSVLPKPEKVMAYTEQIRNGWIAS